MSVRFEVKVVHELHNMSVASYMCSDMSLEIDFIYDFQSIPFVKKINDGIGIRDKYFLLIFGNLTLTFRGESLKLQSIDAYTNNNKWCLANVELPCSVDLAELLIQVSTEEDRFSFDCDPIYIFDKTKKRLLIKVSGMNAARFYRLTNNLIVGVTEENLVSLLIENIDILP